MFGKIICFVAISFVNFKLGFSSSLALCTGYCGTNCTCQENMTYQCADGSCISIFKYRDYEFNCPDKSDESVQCCPDEFKCDCVAEFCKCLKQNLIDNGVQDCLDGTDESSYIEKACSALPEHLSYECLTSPGGLSKGLCISMSEIMNGKYDCPLGDDEDPQYFDECALQLDKCDPNAICKNERSGGYTCTCKTGYVGDGYSCELGAQQTQEPSLYHEITEDYYENGQNGQSVNNLNVVLPVPANPWQNGNAGNSNQNQANVLGRNLHPNQNQNQVNSLVQNVNNAAGNSIGQNENGNNNQQNQISGKQMDEAQIPNINQVDDQANPSQTN